MALPDITTLTPAELIELAQAVNVELVTKQAQLATTKKTALDRIVDSTTNATPTTGMTLKSVQGVLPATAWTPGEALTFRNFGAMTKANVQALTLAQTQELLWRLGPLVRELGMVTIAVGRVIGEKFD